ncbi:MAG: aminoglycoside phosphotransferase [Actinophytocola sp.]|uniref:aminoglycoside phosphotransferase n=1 Tax=Actinophytocola sp. TaxID=1872138 RepID=UPI0013282F55|nr:aminoglycoside phosphotransferase [Actinophytocola sp.]MPZ84924.1 aminoglycoside phosphotransferase [Actinophytocola sp.]
MIDYLVAEPPTDGDATFRNFQRHNVGRAAERFGVAVTGAASFGWRLRSIGVPVTSEHGACWLRVVSEEPQWARGYAWTGNLDANAITNLVKPRVLEVFEWPERDWRNQRAELMTVVPGEPCSPSDVLRAPPDVSAKWWAGLRRSLDTLAATPTERTHADQARVAERVRGRFGDDVDTTIEHWTTAHGGLHWSNLMRPRLGVLDWELWGTAPAGTDAATLLCYGLLVPEVVDQVRDQFADVLDSPSGRVAQLYVVARLLRRIDGGDHPELAMSLTAHARTLLGT